MSDLFSQPFEEDDDGRETRPIGRERRVVTVSELTGSIRALLESGFGDVWVEGEISNCRLWNTGHLFFTLKDGGAQIRVVMYRSAVRYLKFKAEDGQHVVARGRLAVYEPKGEYQLLCDHLQPHGLGALQLAFEQLKKKLQAEGLFEQVRKRALPALPAIIGVVTSLEGAALRDIVKVITRRYPHVHLLIRPTRVQGDGAAAEIADAVRSIGRVRGVSVIIVARGGGAAEDLVPFNQEPVARAIAASPVPIITGVGHEVDFTIADFVADVRAPTPSAAAEIVLAAHGELCARIDRQTGRLRGAMASAVERRRARVHMLTSRRALAGVPARVALRGRHTAELTHQLRTAMVAALARRQREVQSLRVRLDAHDLRRRLAAIHGKLNAAATRLLAAVRRRRDRAHGRLGAAVARLDSLSPLAVLGRGYAVCWNDERTAIVRQASSVQAGDRVHVTLHEGALTCQVQRVE
ncbi:MAG TPA: exodeoxyribonuclease VII large subunit [Vicinamibacterales bacterium]|nr:exodeoxyribonuclease VII large subunit [Vicinamibacterales bacterium]